MHKLSFFAIVVVLSAANAGHLPAQPKPASEKQLDAATVAAYKKLGFSCSGPADERHLLFPTRMETAGIGLPDERVPVFYFGFLDEDLPKGKLPQLPQVAVPFGISFNGRWQEDQDLKPLAGLKNLCYLDLHDSGVTDTGLKELAEHKNLTWLDVSRTRVTDAGLKELAALKQLRYLNVSSNDVTDAGLKELAGLTNLLNLQLSGLGITDKGLKHLSGLKNLAAIHLVTTEVNDDGLKQLAGLKNLVVLNLLGSTNVTDDGVKLLTRQFPKLAELVLGGGYTRATDAALKDIGKLEDLTLLGLLGTQVTDKGLNELAGLKNLRWLDLTGADVTVAGLRELAVLKNLRWLSLRNPTNKRNLTQEGIKELQKALPRCRIWAFDYHGERIRE